MSWIALTASVLGVYCDKPRLVPPIPFLLAASEILGYKVKLLIYDCKAAAVIDGVCILAAVLPACDQLARWLLVGRVSKLSTGSLAAKKWEDYSPCHCCLHP